MEEEKERDEDEEVVIGLSSREFNSCVALAIVKGLLRSINCRDRMSPPEGLCCPQFAQTEGRWLSP